MLWRFHQGALTDRALDRYSISASFAQTYAEVTALPLFEEADAFIEDRELKAYRTVRSYCLDCPPARKKINNQHNCGDYQ